MPLTIKPHWTKRAREYLRGVLGTPQTISNENIRDQAYRQHLDLIHAARIEMVSTLVPKAGIILDLGGANCPLYNMGYPYTFNKLTLIDLPPDQRHDYYKDISINSDCTLGPVFVRYTDMTTLDGIEDESVDLVWSGQSIEHVPLEAGIRMCKEAYRVLKPNGSFCLDTPNRKLTELHTATVGGGFIHPEHFIEYFPDQLTEMLISAGFHIKESLGICEMPKSSTTGEFHYEDFILGSRITKNIESAYIQYHHCIK